MREAQTLKRGEGGRRHRETLSFYFEEKQLNNLHNNRQRKVCDDPARHGFVLLMCCNVLVNTAHSHLFSCRPRHGRAERSTRLGARVIIAGGTGAIDVERGAHA